MVFKPITIDDKESITAYTYPGTYLNCDYAFANMCSWRFLYDSVFTIQDNFLLIRFYVEDKGRKHLGYMFPVGNGDLKHAIHLMEADSESMGHPLAILGITPEAKNQLNEAFPNDFNFSAERDFFDYVYLREELQTLKGKKLQSKRNHINKFRKQYNYTYLPITPDIISQCMELERVWFQANDTESDLGDLSNERRSMIYAMENFDSWGLWAEPLLWTVKLSHSHTVRPSTTRLSAYTLKRPTSTMKEFSVLSIRNLCRTFPNNISISIAKKTWDYPAYANPNCHTTRRFYSKKVPL